MKIALTFEQAPVGEEGIELCGATLSEVNGPMRLHSDVQPHP